MSYYTVRYLRTTAETDIQDLVWTDSQPFATEEEARAFKSGLYPWRHPSLVKHEGEMKT